MLEPGLGGQKPLAPASHGETSSQNPHQEANTGIAVADEYAPLMAG